MRNFPTAQFLGARRLPILTSLPLIALLVLALDPVPSQAKVRRPNAPLPNASAPLSTAMVQGLDASALSRMRNQIYARRGRTFRTYELHRWFMSRDWYRPLKRVKKTPLTPQEVANLKLIRAAEKRLARRGAVDAKTGPRFHLDSAVNLYQYPPFSKKERHLLNTYGMLAMPTHQTQLFHLYESNDYYGLPSFITTDSVLQLFHIFFDVTLRTVEAKQFTPRLRHLLSGLLREASADWRAAKDPSLKAAAARNVAYFAVPLRLLHEKEKRGSKKEQKPTPLAVGNKLVRQELTLIRAAERAPSPLMGGVIDYGQFVPRGHYTRSETLRRYFKAMIWLGQVGIKLRDGAGQTGLLQSLLLVRHLEKQPRRGKPLFEIWRTLYEPTAFFVGLSDEPGPDDLSPIVHRVFGAQPKLEALADKTLRAKALAAIVEVYRRKTKITGRGLARSRPTLRLMGQRFVPDGEVFHLLTRADKAHQKTRLFPNGLDFMAVLGSARAKALLLGEVRGSWSGWKSYPEALDKVTARFARLSDKTWDQSLYYRWLRLLKTLVNERGFAKIGPPLCRSEGWQRKSLSTALGSWAELRHNTLLYAKQGISAECGGDSGEVELWIPEPPKGYVEPNLPFFKRLGALLAYTDVELTRRKMLGPHLGGQLKRFRDLILFLERVVDKQLKGKKRTLAEYEQIQKLGSLLDNLTLSMLGQGKNLTWMDLAGPDAQMSVIADVHTANNRALEVGVGRAQELYALVKIEGKLKLTRGAVFSYYEFPWPAADRLNDAQWQELILDGKQPPQPAWTGPYLVPQRKRRLQAIPSRARKSLPGKLEQFSTKPGWKKITYETGC